MSSALFTITNECSDEGWEQGRKIARAFLTNFHDSTPANERIRKRYVIKPTHSEDTIREKVYLEADTEAEALIKCFDIIVDMGDDAPHQPYDDLWESLASIAEEPFSIDKASVSMLTLLNMSIEDAVEAAGRAGGYDLDPVRGLAGYYNEGDSYDRGFKLKELPSEIGRMTKPARA